MGKFYPAFKKIFSTSFPEYSPKLRQFLVRNEYSKTTFIEKITKKEWLGFIATTHHHILGFLIADNLYGGVSYCHWLAVSKDHQGKSIGSLLLNHWETFIKKLGGHKLVLYSKNKTNHKFFLHHHFKVEGTSPSAWFGKDCWYFAKTIGKPNPKIFLEPHH